MADFKVLLAPGFAKVYFAAVGLSDEEAEAAVAEWTKRHPPCEDDEDE